MSTAGSSAPRPGRRYAIAVAIALLVATVGLVVRNQVKVYRQRQAAEQGAEDRKEVRRQLFDELSPVALRNCRLERFGEPNDGGYLVCANLLSEVQAGYSYGISGYDQWGCDVATRLRIPVHQYDCFDTTVPSCPGGETRFHAECVAAAVRTEDARTFDSITAQLTKNGDHTKRVVVKMDVEGAEWEALETTADDVINRIDQLIMEFHGVDDARYLALVRRLKRFFHVAHRHFNNFTCWSGAEPFPSQAYEVLFVSKRLDEPDASRSAGGLHPLDAPNNPKLPECVPNLR